MAGSGFERRTTKLYVRDLEIIRERTAQKEESISGYVHYLLEFHDRMCAEGARRQERILDELDMEIRELMAVKAYMEGSDDNGG